MNKNSSEFKNENAELTKELSKELINVGFDLSIDYAEVAIDALLQEGLLNEIPLVKTIVAFSKMGIAIKDLHFSRKVLTFLREFHNGSIDGERLESFRRRIEEDFTYRGKVTNHILILLDRIISEYKAKIIAKLFRSYVNSQYDWDTFVDLSISIDSMLIRDFKVIHRLYSEQNIKIEMLAGKNDDKYIYLASIESLKTIGFIRFEELTWESIGDELKKTVFLSDFGKRFYELCLLDYSE